MSDDNLRLKLGVDTACGIAEAQGLQFERAIILQNLSNVIVHLGSHRDTRKIGQFVKFCEANCQKP